MIESARLIHTVFYVDTYVWEVVLEFYVNLPEMKTRENGLNMVYVHGQIIVFTPSIINRMYLIENS